MLQTPPSFIPLIQPQVHPRTHTLVCYRDRVLLRDEDLALPDAATVAALGLAPEQFHALGLWDGRYYQCAWAAGEEAAPAGHSFHGMRSLFGTLPDDVMGLAGRACQIADWSRTHRYCGACATAMVSVAGERCYSCPSCGHAAYPRISPAMMVLIRKGDTVLLARHANAPYQRFTALAGFLEAGESAEEAVHREVYEEVGLRVHNLRYFSSQSWPFPHSLMIAFTADYLEGEIRVDPAEIAEARWFGPDDEWPEMSSSVSVAAALLQAHRPRRP